MNNGSFAAVNPVCTFGARDEMVSCEEELMRLDRESGFLGLLGVALADQAEQDNEEEVW